MTDYGRGPGYEPWQAEDPLYGDLAGQRGPAAPVAGAWDPYAPYDPYATGQQYLPQWDPQPQPGPPQPGPPQPGHPQQYPYQPPPDPYRQYPPQQFAPQAYAGQGTPAAPYAVPPQEYYQPGDQGIPQDWAPGADQPADQTAEWHGYPADPGSDDQDRFEHHPFFDDGADPAYDPDRVRDERRDAATEADFGAPDPDGEYEAYDDLDEPEDAEDSGKQERRGGRKGRSKAAVLAVVLLFTGVVGGGGYEGYQYYQAHYAPPPDYPGQGTGDVEVVIPAGSTLASMGNILKNAGVVESVDAFTAAAAKAGAKLQAGTYELRREMSAAAAVALMMEPASQNAIVIPEGLRAVQIYARIDQRLGLAGGTTAEVAKTADLGLPAYADGNPEGFLFPSRYSIGKDTKPEDLLRQMVKQAVAEYAKIGLEAKAQQLGMTPYQVITVASLAQAEGQKPEDFGKVARVIYNRLRINMKLQLDSTVNYAMNRSTLHTTTADENFPSPYNTYKYHGLPPGPIDNPGQLAIDAAVDPTPGQWVYFVAVAPGDTRFAVTYAEHQQNEALFHEYERTHPGS